MIADCPAYLEVKAVQRGFTEANARAEDVQAFLHDRQPAEIELVVAFTPSDLGFDQSGFGQHPQMLLMGYCLE